MTPEGKILAECRAVLFQFGIPHWRDNTGAAFAMRHIPAPDKGVADLIGVMPDCSGRILCIEVKTLKGVLSEDQKRFHATIRRFNGVSVVVRSAEELEQRLLAEGLKYVGGFEETPQ